MVFLIYFNRKHVVDAFNILPILSLRMEELKKKQPVIPLNLAPNSS